MTMTHDQAHSVMVAALSEIAPDVDLDLLDPDAPFQEEADIDSMDFLNLITRLHDDTGVDIPDSDYPKLSSLTAIFSYLEAKA